MADEARWDYIKELEQDAEMFKEAAESYDILSKHGGEVIVPGFTRMKASDMARLYRQREKDLREQIEDLKKV